MPTTAGRGGGGDEFECRYSICFCMVLQELLEGGWTFRWAFGVSLRALDLSELSRGHVVLDQVSGGLCSGSPTSEVPEFWRVFVEIVFLSPDGLEPARTWQAPQFLSFSFTNLSDPLSPTLLGSGSMKCPQDSYVLCGHLSTLWLSPVLER